MKRYRYSSDVGDKALVGTVIGVGVGLTAGAVGTVWGGYELGSAINDLLNFTNPVGRGALDLIVMSLLAGPALGIGFYGGMAVGAAMGAISHPIIEKSRDLSELVTKGYKKIRGKQTDKPNNRIDKIF